MLCQSLEDDLLKIGVKEAWNGRLILPKKLMIDCLRVTRPSVWYLEESCSSHVPTCLEPERSRIQLLYMRMGGITGCAYCINLQPASVRRQGLYQPSLWALKEEALGKLRSSSLALSLYQVPAPTTVLSLQDWLNKAVLFFPLYLLSPGIRRCLLVRLRWSRRCLNCKSMADLGVDPYY